MFNIINTIILILINIINKFEKKILLLLKKTMLFVKFEKKNIIPKQLGSDWGSKPK
jgi:hypothetical protein